MRLVELRIRGYRRLSELTLDLDHDRLLVLGRNEAGKSTLMECLGAGLYGLAPMKRGSGHAAALRQIAPWTGEPAGLTLRLRLDDGRVLEADWDFSGERVQVIDHGIATPITGDFQTGTHGWIDLGHTLLGLPGSVFSQVTCVGEGQLASFSDNAEVRQSLLRLTDSGVDVLAEHAIYRLSEGARQATIPKANAATRRNELARQLTAAEAQLAAANQARQALGAEVNAIADGEARLERFRGRLGAALAEQEKRDAEQARLRSQIERAQGALAEAELRLAVAAADAGPLQQDRGGWSDAEVEAARQILVAAPEAGAGAGAPSLLGLAMVLVGVGGVVAGVLTRFSWLALLGAGILVFGAYVLTRTQLKLPDPLRIADMVFLDRQSLMASLDHERARRDFVAQHAALERLRSQLNQMLQQPSRAAADASDEEDVRGLSDGELERLLVTASDQQHELVLRLERQRASLERGAAQIPEVAPLEERVADLRQKIELLEAFGLACRIGAEQLTRASEEIRRAYAPKLQEYLSRDLARITAGRYTEVLVDDAFQVLLRAPETSSMVELDKLSRGTQQQIYLLLRLGLLEIMGSNTERLPLLLDDALALSDDERRAELLKVLDREDRQVIYLAAGEASAATDFGPHWHRITLPLPAQVEQTPAELRVIESPSA